MLIRKSEGKVSEIVRIADASAGRNSTLNRHRNDQRQMTAEEGKTVFSTKCKDLLDNSNDDRRGCSRRIERNSRSDRQNLNGKTSDRATRIVSGRTVVPDAEAIEKSAADRARRLVKDR